MAYQSSPSSSSGGGLGVGLDGMVDQVEDGGLGLRRRLDMKASGGRSPVGGRRCGERCGASEAVGLHGCDVRSRLALSQAMAGVSSCWLGEAERNEVESWG